MRPEHDEQLHAYLDGHLNAAEQAAFLEEVARDPQLRDALEAQQALQHSLRRSFAAPDLQELTARVRAAAAGAGTRRSHRGAWRGKGLLAAAALLLVAGAVWLLGGRGGDEVDPLVKNDQPSQAELEASLRLGEEWAELYDFAAYGQKKQKEPPPPVSCTSPDDLATYLPPELFVPGTTLGFEQNPDCTLLEESVLAKKSEAPILQIALGEKGERFALIFLLGREDARRPALAESTGLHLFRRELGNAALYELTPLDHPMGLPRFYLKND